MSFKVKVRVKAWKVNPWFPRVGPLGPATDPDLLRQLYEAAKKQAPLGEGQWTRRWMNSPGLPDPRFSPTCTGSPPPGLNFISRTLACA